MAPPIDSDNAYIYETGTMQILDRLTRREIGTVKDGFEFADHTNHPTPVMGAAGSLFAVNMRTVDGAGNLVNLNAASQAVRCTVAGNYAENSGYHRGTLYSATFFPPALQALREADGDVQWSWSPANQQTQVIDNVLVVDNLVFYTRATTTSAVKRSTRRGVALPGQRSPGNFTQWRAVYPGRAQHCCHQLAMSPAAPRSRQR